MAASQTENAQTEVCETHKDVWHTRTPTCLQNVVCIQMGVQTCQTFLNGILMPVLIAHPPSGNPNQLLFQQDSNHFA